MAFSISKGINVALKAIKSLSVKNMAVAFLMRRPAKDAVIINNVKVRPIVRESQDIQKWRNALILAEGYYQQRGKLYDLYADMMLDGFLRSIIDKRIRGVTNRALTFTVAGETVDEVADLTDSTWFEDFLVYAMESRFWGHSLIEPEWPTYGSDDKGTTYLIPRKHVKPRFGLVTENDFDVSGMDYLEDMAEQVIEIGKPEDLGLLLSASQYVIYKRGNFGDWVEFNEIFGMPFRWATYNNEASREILETAMEQAGSAGYVVAPEDANIQFLHSNTQNGSDLYRFLRMACNEELAVLILGNTMTTTEARQSGYAQGKIHQLGEDQVNKDDRRFILRILNEKVTPFLERLGYPVKGGKWTFEEEDVLSPAQRIDIDLKIASQVPVPASYWYNKYHIPVPTADDPPARKPQDFNKPDNQSDEEE